MIKNYPNQHGCNVLVTSQYRCGYWKLEYFSWMVPWQIVRGGQRCCDKHDKSDRCKLVVYVVDGWLYWQPCERFPKSLQYLHPVTKVSFGSFAHLLVISFPKTVIHHNPIRGVPHNFHIWVLKTYEILAGMPCRVGGWLGTMCEDSPVQIPIKYLLLLLND